MFVVELVRVVDERLELNLRMHRLAARLGDLRPAEQDPLLDRTEEPAGRVEQARVRLEPARDDEADERRPRSVGRQERVQPLGRLDVVSRRNGAGGGKGLMLGSGSTSS